MKQYGFYKATSITRKQVGVIYSKAKSGVLKVEKWFMGDIYDLADYYGYDSNRSVEFCEGQIQFILNAIFENDIEKAQKYIDRTANWWYESYSQKNKAKCDRTVFVA